MSFFLVLLCPALLFGSISNDLNLGLRSLQQIRTLIPERLIDEEFSILVDREAFSKALEAIKHPLMESAIPSCKSIGSSNYYYSRWTISGESVRILDFTQEFEYGPYWLYPTALNRLYDMHHPAPVAGINE